MTNYQQFQLERYGNILPEWNSIYELLDRKKITEPDEYPETNINDYHQNSNNNETL